MRAKIISIMLCLITVCTVLTLPVHARILGGGVALDKAAILEDYNKAALNNKDLTEEEKQEIIDSYGLADHYKICYTVDTDTNTIEIFCGTDDEGNVVYQNMLPYAQRDWVPWLNDYEQLTNIQHVVLKDGVGSLGRYTFWGCDRLETVYLPHSVKKIDRTALYQCKKLETVYYQGSKEDFLKNVKFDQVRNWTENDKGEILFTVMDKMHFGESVTVECVNQEGDVVRTYTVGGYFVGDTYTIKPQEYNGMTYEGKKAEITGTFKENDSTVYRLEYFCDHDYIVSDPTKPCGSFCKYCGRANPEADSDHEWGEPTVVSERGFLTPADHTVTCKVCGLEKGVYEQPYALYVAFAVAVVVLVTAGTLCVVIPLRRKKKLREMTW